MEFDEVRAGQVEGGVGWADRQHHFGLDQHGGEVVAFLEAGGLGPVPGRRAPSRQGPQHRCANRLGRRVDGDAHGTGIEQGDRGHAIHSLTGALAS